MGTSTPVPVSTVTTWMSPSRAMTATITVRYALAERAMCSRRGSIRGISARSATSPSVRTGPNRNATIAGANPSGSPLMPQWYGTEASGPTWASPHAATTSSRAMTIAANT